MLVFLSWSGSLSRSVAEILRDWLPDVVQALEPWTSSEDIDSGARWSTQIAEKLAGTGQGVIVVTRENLSAPWLNFEAGALAKSLSDGQPRPVLVDLAKSELVGPLSQFQMTNLDNQEEMLRLVSSLNSRLDAALPQQRLTRAFAAAWPELQDRVVRARQQSTPGATAVPRPAEDMLEEVLTLVRGLARQANTLAVRPVDIVEALVERAQTEGALTLEELRSTFEQAGIGPAEAGQVIRRLTQAGAILGTKEAPPHKRIVRRSTSRPATESSRLDGERGTRS